MSLLGCPAWKRSPVADEDDIAAQISKRISLSNESVKFLSNFLFVCYLRCVGIKTQGIHAIQKCSN